MALTQFTFARFGYQGLGDLIQAIVVDGQGNVSEDVTPSGSNQVTTAESPADAARYICRVATDTAVYVSFGASPDATTDPDRIFLPAGMVDHFILPPGYKAAVVTIA